MVLANRYFKGVGSTQTSIFSPKTVFQFLHYSQESLRHVCFLQFSLISVRPLHFHISLRNLQIALLTDFPGVIITTSVLFGRSKAVYWLCRYKRYVAKVFCIYRKLFRNRSQRTVSPYCDCKPEHTEMACVSPWMSGKETSTKKLYFHKEKNWSDVVVTAENLSYLFLMQVLQINWFSMVKLREAVSEREIGLFITNRIQQFEEK